jgi:hypothetical protein
MGSTFVSSISIARIVAIDLLAERAKDQTGGGRSACAFACT